MANDATRVIGKDLVTLDQAARTLAQQRIEHQDWSGLPMPVPGLSLVLEPRYKHKGMENFQWKECYYEDGTRHEIPDEPKVEASDWRRVNSWWNSSYQVTIIVYQNSDRHSRFAVGSEDRLAFTIRTLEAAAVWPVEAEQKALAKLAGLIPKHLFDLYQLTGHFSEVSKRSSVAYIFRRGRPTIALREHEDGSVPLCALCLHPIGYYAQTWAGVMCPTDEVIAHLLMMRGSEEKYWANANQHPVDHPAAGI